MKGLSTVARYVAAVAAIFVIAPALLCHAQSAPGEGEAHQVGREIWRVGAYGGAQLIGYTADMKGLPEVPSCCPRYSSGTGSGFAFGLSGEYPLLPYLSGGIRVLFASYGGSLTAQEQELVTSEKDTVTATFGHTIEASQPAIAIEAMVTYKPIPSIGIQGGLRADVMSGGTFHQREEIVTPATIRFENDLRRRLVFDGDIPQERSMHVALIAGVRYDLPLNSDQTLLLSPEVQVWQGLTDLVDGEIWKMRGIRGGITLHFMGRAVPQPLTPITPGKSQGQGKPSSNHIPDLEKETDPEAGPNTDTESKP